MANAQQNRDLAIFQLVVYLVLTPFVLFVFIKVGRRSLRNVPGWIWPISEWFWMMGFFGLVLGSSGLTISAGLHSTSTIGLILSAVGLCPLFLAVDSAIHETVYSTSINDNLLFHPVASLLLHFLVVAAAVLTGIGASELFSSSSTPAKAEGGSHLVKAGILLFLVIWVWLAVTALVSLKGWRRYSSTRSIIIAIIISIPLLAVRVIFGILEFFLTSSSVFNPIDGSIVVKLLMSTLPMMGVAMVLVVAGFFTDYKVSKHEHELNGIPLTLRQN